MDHPTPFIVEGTPARADEFPEFAVMKIYFPDSDQVGLCSATMIAPNKVLTAAHCIDIPGPGGRFTIIPAYFDQPLKGAPELEISVSEVQVHPDYYEDFFGLTNDIAVLTIDTELDTRVAAVLVGQKPLAGKPATGLGMGITDYEEQTFPAQLLKFHTRIPSNEACNNDELSGFYYEPWQICVSPRFSPAVPCLGDSGGPLIVRASGRNAVAGILSILDSECISEYTFAAYTRVSEYTDFIREHSPDTQFVEIKEIPPLGPLLDLLILNQQTEHSPND